MTNPLESLPSGLPEKLSALMDGELNAWKMADFWAQLGAQGEEVRADWHAFQLIGDVLRSEDLASTAQHDAAFLAALRERFQSERPQTCRFASGPPRGDEETWGGPAFPHERPQTCRFASGPPGGDENTWGGPAFSHEPVVLAPVSRAAPVVGGRAHRWAWPSAAAVGVVMVSAAVWNARLVGPQSVPATLVQAPLVAPPVGPTAAAVVSPAETTASVARTEQGRLIRDPQIDRYLAAHQQFVGSSALGAPSGFIRNAAVDVPRH